MSGSERINRQVLLAVRPTGIPQSSDFEIIRGPIRRPDEGELLVRNHYLSVEPAMRGWIADAGNYSAPVAIGSVMRALAVGEVIESNLDGYVAGEKVTGWFGWQDYATVSAEAVIRKVSEQDLPLSLSLGILGINGITALLALTSIGQPVAGETVVVSTAAGAVGSAAGQIANILGCRTIGIAGGARKIASCTDYFGFDAAIDYKAGPIVELLAQHCPEGINIYFDNVAGAISDEVMRHLANRARVIVCGTASVGSWQPWPHGPRVERHLLVKRARMEGFVIFDHANSYQSAVDQLAVWVRSGQLRYIEDVLHGIERAPDAIAGLYRGENRGKRLIKLE